MDKGHEFVDNKLIELEEELKLIYSKTIKEVEKNIKKQSNKIILNPQASQKEIRAAVNRLNSLYKTLTVELNNADLRAVDLLKKELEEIGLKNLEYADKQIRDKIKKLNIDQTFTLFNKEVLGAILQGSVFTNLAIEGFTDKNFIYRELKRNFAIGMLQGEGIPKLAKRIQGVINSNMKRAVLIARTENTRVENEARNEVFNNASKNGIELKKKWLSARDSRVRKSHSFINGEVAEMNEQFSNGLEYPGDPSGDPREVCNCRCSMVSLVKGVDY